MKARSEARAAQHGDTVAGSTVAELRGEIAELRQRLEALFASHDRLLALVFDKIEAGSSAETMTVQEAAEAAGYTRQTIRNWCGEHGIGEFRANAQRFFVSRAKLRQYMLDRFGKLPHGLRQE